MNDDDGMTEKTPEQHLAEGLRLLARADATAEPDQRLALAATARAHFAACTALQVLRDDEPGEPGVPWLPGGYVPPKAFLTGSGPARVGIRLDGASEDIAGVAALLELRHVHLDGLTTPARKRDGRGWLAYASIDIGEYRDLAARLAADRAAADRAAAEPLVCVGCGRAEGHPESCDLGGYVPRSQFR